MKRVWIIWAKALGEKAADCDRTADRVAMVRTLIVSVNIITCMFIVANIIHNW